VVAVLDGRLFRLLGNTDLGDVAALQHVRCAKGEGRGSDLRKRAAAQTKGLLCPRTRWGRQRGRGLPKGDGCGDNEARPFRPCHYGERTSR